MHIKNNKNKGKSSEQRYCLFLYNSEVFLNVPAIRQFVGFTLHSIVKNTSSFEKKEKCNCTPLQKCCKHFGWLWLFFSSCWFVANFLDEKKIIERKLDQYAHFEREDFLKSFWVTFWRCLQDKAKQYFEAKDEMVCRNWQYYVNDRCVKGNVCSCLERKFRSKTHVFCNTSKI